MKNKLYLLLLLLSIAVVNSAQAQTKRLSKSEVDAEEAFVNAKILVLNGKDEAAKKAFADLLKKDKTNPDIAYELARIEFLQGDDEMAYRHGQIAAQDQRNSWYQLLFGDILQKMGKLKEAALIYEQLATQHPLVKDYYYNGAECYEKMEDFSKALATYENCEKINGYDIVTTKKKQLIYLKTGKPEAATSELIKLITSNPNNLDYRYYLATLYEKLGKIELARETYAGILKINPNEVRASLAMIDKQPSNGDYNTVLTALKPLFLKKEVSLDLKIKELIPIAQKVADTGDKALANTALEYVKILHTVHPDEAKVYAIEGDFLYYSGNLDAAFSCYQKVLDRNKTIFPVWNQALTILEEQKKYSALLDLAEKALDYFPNQAVVHYYHGIANMQLNKPEDAIVAYKTGLNLTNKNVLLQGDILKKLLQVYLESKKNNEAKALLSKYLPREGEYEASVLEVFGDTFFNLGETENALLYWTKSQQKRQQVDYLTKENFRKKNMNNLSIQVAVLLLLVTTVACRPKKTLPSETIASPAKTENTVAPTSDSTYLVQPKSVEEILAAHMIPYQFFSGSGDIDYSDADQRFSGTITIRMIPDSVAWFSIQKFGFEGMRGLFTKDSMYLLNRLEQSYLTKSIQEVSGLVGFPLKIRDLQNLILGNPILPLAEKPCFSQDKTGYSIVQKNQNSEEFNLNWNFSTQKLSSMQYSNKIKKINFDAQQQDYQENIQLNNYKFSYLRTMKLLSPDMAFDLKLLFTEAKWNESKKLPFEIPSYYTKVTQF